MHIQGIEDMAIKWALCLNRMNRSLGLRTYYSVNHNQVPRPFPAKPFEFIMTLYYKTNRPEFWVLEVED